MLKKLFFLVFLLILVGSLILSGYYFMKYQESQKLLTDPTLAGKQEATTTIAKIGKLMELPKNEEPTFATVSDISKLKGQEFFAKAKNGDKILIYTTKKEIILYRPSTNKIINVAPININTAQKQASPSGSVITSSPTQPVNVTPVPSVPAATNTATP